MSIRKIVLLGLAIAMVALFVAAAPAIARSFECTSDVCKGTSNRDSISGDSSDQTFFGRRGSDRIDGGGGNDTVFGGQGNDFIDVHDGNNGQGEIDQVDCDGGTDTVVADSQDIIAENCENVSFP